MNDFARCLRVGNTPWGSVRIMFEFNYLGGYADMLALAAEGELIAFEAKLTRWRDALHQAYRTLCFAHRSYVVVPLSIASNAASHAHEFHRRRVGLCSFSVERGIEVILEAETSAPLQPWVAVRAVTEVASIREERKTECRLKKNSTKSRKQSVRIGA